MPFKRQFRDKYASRSPERICCLNSVQLVSSLNRLTPYDVWHTFLSIVCNAMLSPPFFFDPFICYFLLTSKMVNTNTFYDIFESSRTYYNELRPRSSVYQKVRICQINKNWLISFLFWFPFGFLSISVTHET